MRRLLPVPTGAEDPVQGYGTVVSVEVRQADTELIGLHTAPLSVLHVQSVSELPSSGTVQIGDDALAYTAIDDLSDPDTTATAETITLAATTTNTYADRTLVTLTPVREYKAALVVLDQAPGIAIECLVDYKIEDSLEEGPRPDGEGEIVWVTQRRGELGLTVETVKGRRKKVDGGYLDGRKPATPGALVESYAQFPEEHAGSLPPAAVGSGVMPADVQVGGLLTAGGMAADLQGFHVTRPDGSAALDAPVDGRPVRISGEVDATKVITTDGARLGGPSTIPAGSSVRLSAQLEPPWLSPSVSTSWPKADVAFTAPRTSRIGLGVESITPGSEVAYAVEIDPSSGLASLVTFNPVTGAVTSTLPMTGAPQPGRIASATYSSVPDRVETLEWVPTQAAWKVRWWHPATGNFDSQWAWVEGGTTEYPRPSMGLLGFLGVEYATIARSNPDGTVQLHQYADQVATTSVATADVLNLGDLTGCAKLGATIILTGLTNPVFPAGMPAPPGLAGEYPGRPVMPVINLAFFGSPGDLLGWLCVGDGNPSACGVTCMSGDTELRTFYLSSSNNMLIQHSNVFEAGDYFVQASWLDMLLGTESLPSPPVMIKKIPGSQIRMSIANPPPGFGATSIGAAFYMGSGATFPGNAAMFLQKNAAQTDGIITTDPIFHINTSGIVPLTVPTLTDGGDPAELLADDGTAQIRADKTGEIYDLLAVGAGDIIGGSP